ncbi:MAG: methylmalonyl Co-A mutase-associated GTPase MeaB [Pseudomonadota bacterium]
MFEGSQRALGRLISAVENGAPDAGAVLAAIEPHLGGALVIGITGAPGVGKSSLVSALVSECRRREWTVGVVAVDPSSPVSGGAILGDRLRMAAHISDTGVFVRSVSARGHLGGLSATTSDIVDLMDAAGHNIVIVETVGAGQSEVEIAELADCRIVVSAPGLGDHVQAIKAGILEIADVLVVNKADLPGADRTQDQLRAMLRLRTGSGATVKVMQTCATDGRGLSELANLLETLKTPARESVRTFAAQNRLRRVLARAVRDHAYQLALTAPQVATDALWHDVRAGRSSLEDAACRLLRELTNARITTRPDAEQEYDHETH